MKKSYFFILIILFVSCNSSQETQFDWLLGTWERTNDSKGNKTYEYWTKKSDTEYIGLGCTLKEKDTVFKENIHLIKDKEQWVFKVIGVNETPTLFPITSLNKTSFIGENPENEFPKKIIYSSENGDLKAVISAGDDQISFLFKKK
ncbi:DUF6265 family protein [Pseudofulvibacter geojedonensis]|uniref:DUF6265 family protein n=1 Tax=Pseudofulvibacter geojedonensis TaxID=1123758 RepID=A0ABW3I0B2_9FLAO